MKFYLYVLVCFLALGQFNSCSPESETPQPKAEFSFSSKNDFFEQTSVSFKNETSNGKEFIIDSKALIGNIQIPIALLKQIKVIFSTSHAEVAYLICSLNQSFGNGNGKIVLIYLILSCFCF